MDNPILSTLSRPQLEALIVDLSKRWLAHDGLWFQAIEADQGMTAAIRYDATAWSTFTVIEAKRILAFLGLPPGGGLDVLEQALPLRLYGFINDQDVIRVDAHTLVLRMNNCRVQSARARRGDRSGSGQGSGGRCAPTACRRDPTVWADLRARG